MTATLHDAQPDHIPYSKPLITTPIIMIIINIPTIIEITIIIIIMIIIILLPKLL